MARSRIPSISSSTSTSWRLACLTLGLLILLDSISSTSSNTSATDADEALGSSGPLSFYSYPPPSPRLLLRRRQRQLQQTFQADAQADLPPSVPVSVALGGNAASSPSLSSPFSSLKNTTITTSSGPPAHTNPTEASRGNSSTVDSSSVNSEAMHPVDLPVLLGLDSGRPAQVLYPSHIPHDLNLPLVLVLHAWGSNATYHASYLGVTDRVQNFNFIALLPDGIKNSKGFRFWNAPACCNRENIAVDDLGYLTDLLNEAKRKLPVDPEKIFIIGHSNGGQMALYLTCRYKEPGRIRGLVSIAGFGLPPGCQLPQPSSALFVHGTEDDIVPYASSVQVFNEWVERQNCLPDRPPVLPPSSTVSASASSIGALRDPPPSVPFCKRSKNPDPSSLLFPEPPPSSMSSSAYSTCTQFNCDFDCDSVKESGVKDPTFSNYRDSNCGLGGNETVVTQYVDCGIGREEGGKGGANVTFWRMEGATHVPALSPKAQDEMMTFLLGPPSAMANEKGGGMKEGGEEPGAEQQQDEEKMKKKRKEKLRV